MGGFLDAAVAFPTAIFSTLLAVALVYWLLAVLGLVDDGDGLALDGSAEGAADVGTLAGYVVAFGLHGVPFSLSLSLVFLAAWTFSCLGGMWLLPLLPEGASRLAGGAVLGLGSLSLAVPVASQAVRPLRRLFVTHTAIHNASLIGQSCKVLTGTVDDKVGRAEVQQLGATLNIRVWAPVPNTLTRGAPARIVAYDERASRYRIEADRG